MSGCVVDRSECPQCFSWSGVITVGSFFVYRRIDVLRLVALAKAAAGDARPRIIDVGCGSGSFTKRFLRGTGSVEIIGVDPDDKFAPAPWRRRMRVQDLRGEKFHLAFVGWMEVDCDYREPVSKLADVIVSAFDDGGSCGIDGKVDYDTFGFVHIARWYSPAWYNCYFDSYLERSINLLHANCWDVYSRSEKAKQARAMLERQCRSEMETTGRKFEHEKWLDAVFPRGSGGRRTFWEVRFRTDDDIAEQIETARHTTPTTRCASTRDGCE